MHQLFESRDEHRSATYISIQYAFYMGEHNHVGMELGFKEEHGLEHSHIADHIHAFNSKLH